jgi:hypothetical protein
MFSSPKSAIVIVGAVAVSIFMAIQFAIYSLNNYELHVAWYIIDIVICVAISFALLILLGG